MLRLLALLALTTGISPALADDEASEHTAQLHGDASDTLGVTVDHDAKAGWSMTVRPTPGADPITTPLVLPNTHAHYIVYVTPGRGSIAFVEYSAGRGPLAKDTVAWVYTPDGKLLRSWTFGAIVDGKELAQTRASTSHFSVFGDVKPSSAGLQFTTRLGGKTVTLAPDATTFR